MKRLSGFFQFIIGFFLGVLLLAGGAAAIGFVFFSRFNAPPPKPIFAEEKESEKTSANNQPAASQPEKSTISKEKTEPKPTASAQNTEEEALPSGSYKARVTWSTGLSLRSRPSRGAERIGGVDYNTELIILEKSRDGEWEKVRLVNGTQEGWVKAGNVEKLSE